MTHLKILSTLVSLIIMTTGCTRFKSASPQGNSKSSPASIAETFGLGGDSKDKRAGSLSGDSGQSQNGSSGDTSGPSSTTPPADSPSGGTSAPPPQDGVTGAGTSSLPAGTTPAPTPSVTPAAPVAGASTQPAPASQPVKPAVTPPAVGSPAVTPTAPTKTTSPGDGSTYNPFANSTTGSSAPGTQTGQNAASEAAAQAAKPAAPAAGASTQTTTPSTGAPAGQGGKTTSTTSKPTGAAASGTTAGAGAASGAGAGAGANKTPTTTAGSAKDPATTSQAKTPTQTPASGATTTPSSTTPSSTAASSTADAGKTGAASTDSDSTKPANPYVSNNIPTGTTPGVVVANPDPAQVNSGAITTPSGTNDPKTTATGTGQTTTTGAQPLGAGAAAGTGKTPVQKAPTAGGAPDSQNTVTPTGIAVTKWKLNEVTQKLYDFLTSVSAKKSEIQANNPEITQWKVCAAKTPTLFDSSIQTSTFRNALGTDSGLAFSLRVKQLNPAEYGLSTEIMGGLNKKNEPLRAIDLLNYGFVLGYDVLTQTEGIINSIELQNSSALSIAASCAKSPSQLACKNWSAQRSQLQALNKSLRVLDGIQLVQRPSQLKCGDIESDLYYELVVNKKSVDQTVNFYKKRLETASECFSRSRLSQIKNFGLFKSALAKPDLDASEKMLAIKSYVSLLAKMISRMPSKPKSVNLQTISKLRSEINVQVVRIKNYLNLTAPFLKYTKMQNFELNDQTKKPIPVIELATALTKSYTDLSKARQQRLGGDTLQRLNYKSAMAAVLSAAPSSQQGDSCRVVEFLLKDPEKYVNRFVEDIRLKSWAQQTAQEKSGFLIPFNLQAVAIMNGYKSSGAMVIDHQEISKSLLQCFALVQGKDSVSSETCLKLPATRTTGEAVLAKILASIQ